MSIANVSEYANHVHDKAAHILSRTKRLQEIAKRHDRLLEAKHDLKSGTIRFYRSKNPTTANEANIAVYFGDSMVEELIDFAIENMGKEIAALTEQIEKTAKEIS